MPTSPGNQHWAPNCDSKVEKLIDHTEPAPVKGWRLLNIHAHTATKIAALLDRPDTEKGEKDAREIDRLLQNGAAPVETIAGSAARIGDSFG